MGRGTAEGRRRYVMHHMAGLGMEYTTNYGDWELHILTVESIVSGEVASIIEIFYHIACITTGSTPYISA